MSSYKIRSATNHTTKMVPVVEVAKQKNDLVMKKIAKDFLVPAREELFSGLIGIFVWSYLLAKALVPYDLYQQTLESIRESIRKKRISPKLLREAKASDSIVMVLPSNGVSVDFLFWERQKIVCQFPFNNGDILFNEKLKRMRKTSLNDFASEGDVILIGKTVLKNTVNMTGEQQMNMMNLFRRELPPTIFEFSKNAIFLELERASLNEKDYCKCGDMQNFAVSGIQTGMQDFIKKALVSVYSKAGITKGVRRI